METLGGALKAACKEFEEDLVLHYYGELSLAERKRVESHVAACSVCRGFADDLGRLLPQMAKPMELPDRFWDNYYREVIDKITEQRERTHWWREMFAPMRLWAVPAFGAATVLVFGLTLTLGKVGWNPLSEPKQGLIPQEVLSDENKVEFFKSMELVESLRTLEALDVPVESTNAGRS
jgi:predicted anti-sigma-YlaC factor YlaD